MNPEDRGIIEELEGVISVSDGISITGGGSSFYRQGGTSIAELEDSFWRVMNETRAQRNITTVASSKKQKRHLTKGERDSRHNPAPDAKKILSISLDDLISL